MIQDLYDAPAFGAEGTKRIFEPQSVLPYRVINLHSETLTRVLECPFGQQRQAISTAVPVLHCKPSYAGRYALQKGFRWCCCRRQLIVSISNRAEHCYLQTWVCSEFAILCNASYEAVSNNGTARNCTTPNNHAFITFLSFSFFLLFSFLLFFLFSFFFFLFHCFASLLLYFFTFLLFYFLRSTSLLFYFFTFLLFFPSPCHANQPICAKECLQFREYL